VQQSDTPSLRNGHSFFEAERHCSATLFGSEPTIADSGLKNDNIVDKDAVGHLRYGTSLQEAVGIQLLSEIYSVLNTGCPTTRSKN